MPVMQDECVHMTCVLQYPSRDLSYTWKNMKHIKIVQAIEIPTSFTWVICAIIASSIKSKYVYARR